MVNIDCINVRIQALRRRIDSPTDGQFRDDSVELLAVTYLLSRLYRCYLFEISSEKLVRSRRIG